MRAIAYTLLCLSAACGPATPADEAKPPPTWPELRASDAESRMIENSSMPATPNEREGRKNAVADETPPVEGPSTTEGTEGTEGTEATDTEASEASE